MKKILIVMDLDMKKMDAITEFNFYFLKECSCREISVEFMIPTQPCSLVKEKLGDVNFSYTVLENWWGRKDKAKRHNMRIIFPILRYMKFNKIDLVEFQFCSELTVLIISLMSRAMFRKPVLIWHQHCEIKTESPLFLLRKIKEHFSKIRLLSYFVDGIRAVSKTVSQQILAKGISRKKITVISNGIAPERFDVLPTERDRILNELKIKKDELVVMSVANPRPEKGVQYLLEAAAIILKSKAVKFVIVGDGPFLENLKSLASALGIAPQVLFTGLRNDVSIVLSVADVYVQPSLQESFGIAIIEAMAAKKPIVASNVGGIPCVVRSGVNGILVPPKQPIFLAEAIIKLLNDSKLAKEMGLKGRGIVAENFSLTRCIQEHFLLYEKYLGKIV